GIVAGVDDGQVRGQEATTRRAHPEIALMPPRHRENDALGQLEKLARERPNHDIWLLDQGCVFAHKKVVFDEVATGRACRGAQPIEHLSRSLGWVDDNVRSSQHRLVVVRRRDGERARSEEAMPTRVATARDPGKLEVDNVRAKESDDPLNGPAKKRVAGTPP